MKNHILSSRLGGAPLLVGALLMFFLAYQTGKAIPKTGVQILIYISTIPVVVLGLKDRVVACIAVIAMIYFGFLTTFEVGSMAKLSTGVFFFWYLTPYIVGRRKIDFKNNYFLFCYAVIFFLSAFYNNYVWFSHDHQMVVVGIALYVMIRYLLRSVDDVHRFVLFYVALILGVILIGSVTTDFSLTRFARFSLGGGVTILSTSNTLSEYICVTIPMALYGLQIEKSRLRKGFYLFATGIFVYTIIMTVSRSGLISMIFGIFLWVALVNGSKKVVYAMIAVLLVIGAYMAVPEQIKEHLSIRLTTTGTAAGDLGRIGVLKAGLGILQDSPLLGVGPGNYSAYCYKLSGSMFYKPSHNVYLQVFAETGILAGALFLFALAYAFLGLRKAAKHFRRKMDSKSELLATTLAVSLLTMMVVSLFFNNKDAKSWFILLGCAEAMRYLSERKDQR